MTFLKLKYDVVCLEDLSLINKIGDSSLFLYRKNIEDPFKIQYETHEDRERDYLNLMRALLPLTIGSGV